MRVRAVLAPLLALALVAGPVPRAAHAAAAHVVLNELHYHAADDDPAEEFVELYNAGDAAQDLDGWCIEGISFCFAGPTLIGPGTFRVVPATQYSGALSNGGEHVRLRDGTNAVVDDVDYDDHGAWPALADGEGGSLERRDPNQPGNDPGNWMSSPAPTPGAPNTSAGVGLLPVFDDVTNTVLPAPDAPIDVEADLDHASSATLVYRIGFAAEISVSMVVAAGQATAQIPGQPAGALVRYRLTATESARTGTWPRQGDGSTYTGTTVADATTSALPRFQWFMEDGLYAKAYKDLTLSGDQGYPCVIALDGHIADNTLVRVKGQASRAAKKKKWKFSLAPGHELDIPDLGSVDEFALHGSATDRSFIRETLASEWMTAAGVVGTQRIFPVRLEKNGGFYGLYSFVEQPDGDWRERSGFDDAVVYEAGANGPNIVMAKGDASLSQKALRARYDKETFEYQDDADLRTLIRTVNAPSNAARRAWIERHVDIPQVLNALAAAQVIQHGDFGHKNYRLVLATDGRWQLVPNDFDLTFGTNFDAARNSPYDDVLSADKSYPWAASNRLARVLWTDPVWRSMFDRRVRTLSEQLLGPEPIESRVAELEAQIAPEAALDRAVWGTYGEPQTALVAGEDILGTYVPFRRTRLLGTLVARGTLPGPQPALPGVTIASVDADGGPGASPSLVLSNPTGLAVDVSGWAVQPLGVELPPGTVIAAHGQIRFVRDLDLPGPGAAEVQPLAADLPGFADLRLVTANGDVVSTLTYGTPPSPIPFVIVNEINAVADNKTPVGGADPYWGLVPTGNGKDWIELVVVSDHTDLRGWHVRVSDNAAPAVDLVLPGDAGLSDVRSGVILTISEQLATDLGVNPGGGDWWMNLQLTGFDTSNNNTQVEVRDAANQPVFGPVGEGVNPASGVGSDELAALDASPSASTTAASPYQDAKTSSFGQPNALSAGGTQDFSGLRDPVVAVPDVTAPSNVTGLAMTNVAGRTADLTWNAATDDTGVTGYRVYVNGHLAGVPASPAFGLTDLPDGTTALVEVVAVDAAGNRSAIPAALTRALPDDTGPGPARHIVKIAARTTVRINWTSSPDVSGVASYRIERVGGPVYQGNIRTARFTGLARHTTYTFVLTATDKLGNVGQPVTLVVTTT